MSQLDWLLAYLDESDVSELVLGLDRPPVVRAGASYRAVTSVAFARNHIEALVSGTPLAGLIDSPASRPPVEIDVGPRRLVVEVIRSGKDAALRISLPRAPTRTTTPPPRTATTPPPRTATMPPPRTATMPPPPASAPTPPPPSAPTPPASVPTPRAPTRSGVAVTAAPSEPRTSPPAEGSAPIRAPSGSVAPPTIYFASGGEIQEVSDEPEPPPPEPALEPPFEQHVDAAAPLPELEGAPDEWFGPRILDETFDISPLRVLLEQARTRNASDLHIIAGRPISIRRFGDIVPLEPGAPPLDPETAERLLVSLLGENARKKLEEVGYVDLGLPVPGRGRVRGNISRQQDGLAGSFRLSRDQIPTLDSLGLPKELAKVVRFHQGLVVIAGPSGHGKTTTMGALVDLLNSSNSDHIITIEDPVEIEHPPKRAIVSHREVGRHTLSFLAALKASLREDPDVIVIGELRDRETVEIALTAAETGHLVLATISTPSAVKTIDRLIDMFPPDDQVQVRASISGTLRAVIAQRLLPNATGDGMVPAIEVVTGVLPLATLIRENKLYQLPSLMQRGRGLGMIRLDESLLEHVRARRITEAVALQAAENRKELMNALQNRSAATTKIGGLFGPKGPA